MVTACSARCSSYIRVNKSLLIGAAATLISAVAILSINSYASKNLNLGNVKGVVYGTLASIAVGVGGICCVCYSIIKKCNSVPSNPSNMV